MDGFLGRNPNQDETKKQVKLDQSLVEGCFFLLQRSKVAVFFVALDRKKIERKQYSFHSLTRLTCFASEDQTFCDRLLRFAVFQKTPESCSF